MWYLRLNFKGREKKETLDMRELTLDIMIRKFSTIYFVIKILIKVVKQSSIITSLSIAAGMSAPGTFISHIRD